jgi:hypothetical protein
MKAFVVGVYKKKTKKKKKKKNPILTIDNAAMHSHNCLMKALEKLDLLPKGV